MPEGRIGERSRGRSGCVEPEHGGVDVARKEGFDVGEGSGLGQLGEQVPEVGVGVEAVRLGGLCRPPNYAEQFWSDAL